MGALTSKPVMASTLALATIVATAVMITRHRSTTDNFNDFERSYICKATRSAFFASAEEAEKAFPDAKTIVHVTMEDVQGQFPLKPLSEENQGLAGFAVVDQVIRGSVPENRLFVGVANQCLRPLQSGEKGFIAGKTFRLNSEEPDGNHLPVFILDNLEGRDHAG